MKIVNILGGLGNQMFQYAFAIKLKHLFPNDDIKIYTGAFRGYHLHNGYELSKVFNISIPVASIWEASKVYWPIFDYTSYRIFRYYFPLREGFRDSFSNPINLGDINRYSFFDGYFQRYYYYNDIKEVLKKYMKFSDINDKNNLKALEFINNAETTSIHIRRGDYLSHPKFGGICDIEYYKKAIKVILEQTDTTQFLIFSNDIEWTKDNLHKDISKCKVQYVNWNQGLHSFRDIQLMSLCHNNIIANSSFSWWGAFLNIHNNSMVLCPSKWTIDNINTSIFANTWIKIPV